MANYGSKHEGGRFGSWTILRVLVGKRGQCKVAVARCDCGTESEVFLNNLTSGRSKRCRTCYLKRRKRPDLLEGLDINKDVFVSVEEIAKESENGV
jgi:hypothetical protein